MFRELRLVEAMDGICDKILEYNMHKERTGSLRFAKVKLLIIVLGRVSKPLPNFIRYFQKSYPVVQYSACFKCEF